MSSSPKSLPIKSFLVSNRTQISATNLNSSLEFSSQCNIPPPRTNSPPKTTMSSNLFVLPARFCVSPFVSNQTLTSDLSSPENCVNTSTPLSTNCFNSATVNSESPVSHTKTLSLTTRPTVFSGVSPIADFHEMSTRPDANSMDLASLFECPVCTDFALPPIMQCQSGHIVCLTCRAKLSSCPTCRGNLENIRNLAMEKLAASVLFPCKYSVTGCSETFHYTTKSEHEAICAYRPYICPCPGASCKWLGQLEHVMSHLMQSHKSITTLQGEDIVFLATDITLPGAVDWVMMQSCFGHHFMLVLEKQENLSDQLFYALVLLIGTKKMAENFVYRLDLTAPTRRLTWESTPHNIHDGVQAAISVSDCLVFNANQAQLFSDNGSLGINVTISKVRTS